MRLLDTATSFVQVAILAAAGVMTLAGKQVGDPLRGVTPTKPVPHLTLGAMLDESYQKSVVAWFEDHWSLKPLGVRLDNSISYWGFVEARPDKQVFVGRDDTFFMDEMIWEYNRDDTPDVQPFVQRFVRADAAARARGKAFVLAILPSKAWVARNEFPPQWEAPRATPRPCDARTYEPFVAAMRASGVPFVDGRAVLEQLTKEDPWAVYPKTGRHLSTAASCMVMKDAWRAAARIGLDPSAVDCAYTMTPTPFVVTDDDYDLFSLLNVWTPPRADRIPHSTKPPPAERVANAPDTLFVGSSFVWRLVRELDRNRVLGHTHVFYYNKTAYDWDKPNDPFPVEPETPRWREILLSKQLYIVDMPEEFMLGHMGEFVDQLTKVLTEGEGP
jgi:hypothetical protein